MILFSGPAHLLSAPWFCPSPSSPYLSSGTRRRLRDLTLAETTIKQELLSLQTTAADLGCTLSNEAQDVGLVSGHIEEDRRTTRNLELAVATLEASKAYERVSMLERDMELSKADVAKIESQGRKLRHAIYVADEIRAMDE